MTSRRFALVPALPALLALAAILVATPASAATKQEYIASANQICAPAEQSSSKLLREGFKNLNRGKPKPAATAFSSAGRIILRATDEVDSLERPADLPADAYASWVSSSRKLAQKFISLASALRGNERKKVRSLTRQITRIAGESEKAADQVGFSEC